jgi:hypothetical protein
VDIRVEDDVEAPDVVDLDGDGDIERDGDDDEEEDEEEEDEEKEDEEVVKEEDEDEKKDKDKDDGKEPQTIGQGEMVNKSADEADTMVDNEPTVLPEPSQGMCQHNPRPQPLAPAPRPETTEPPPQPQTPETHSLSGLKFMGLVTPPKPCSAVAILRDAEAARNNSDVDVEQQLLGESAAGDSLPDVPLTNVPLPGVPLPDVLLPDVPFPNVPLPDFPLPEARPDG